MEMTHRQKGRLAAIIFVLAAAIPALIILLQVDEVASIIINSFKEKELDMEANLAPLVVDGRKYPQYDVDDGIQSVHLAVFHEGSPEKLEQFIQPLWAELDIVILHNVSLRIVALRYEANLSYLRP